MEEFDAVGDMFQDGECLVRQGTVLIDSAGVRWMVMPSDDAYHLHGSVMKIGHNDPPRNADRMAFPVVISDDDNFLGGRDV